MPAGNRLKTARRTDSSTPQWFLFGVVVSITFTLCLAINFRAFSEMNAEAVQNTQLNAELEKLSGENLALQDEVHNLKSDSRAIEREARKIGMSRPNEKILVPVN
ncbi:MAG: septum formation initiator family protein [Actinomycetota bacterium]